MGGRSEKLPLVGAVFHSLLAAVDLCEFDWSVQISRVKEAEVGVMGPGGISPRRGDMPPGPIALTSAWVMWLAGARPYFGTAGSRIGGS